MKFRVFGAVTLLGVVAIFAGAANAQKVGGYRDIPKTDSGAKAAAEFAVSTQAEKSNKEIELVSVHKAERQVVAGSNYRLCLKITTSGDNGDVTSYVKVVVYQDLKQEYKLTSWEKSDCGGDDDD